jgi:hypothetical protein
MKAQSETITLAFESESAFDVAVKPAALLRLDMAWPPATLECQRQLPAPERFESRGVPESALHD